jgi:pimeloyl-ACP methyl ester carboxylesterase
MSFKKLQFRILVAVIGSFFNFSAFFSKKWAGRKMAQLFGKPRKGRLSADERNRLQAAEELQLTYENLSFQCYHWRGDVAKTVVLLHGWESNAARWHPLVKLLKKENYNIVAFDAPAHGDSAGDYFEAILFAKMLEVVVQRFEPQTLIGHSVGAYSVAYWAGHFLVKNSDKTPLSPQESSRTVKRLILMASPSNLSHVFDQFLGFINANRRVRAGFYAHIENYLGQKVADITAEKMLKSLSINALIIHDRQDDVIAFSEAEAIHHALPEAEFVATDGFGHRLRDASVYKMIVEYLKKEV